MKNSSKYSFVKTILLLTSIALITSFIACSQQGRHKITIMHTNDIHGHFLSEPATWIDGRPEVGGFTALDYYVQEVRDKSENSLLFDAGDLMTGNLICNMEYENVEGGALIEMMNMIGYDGMVIGNHEFDNQAENVRGLVELSEFPMICANLVDSGGIGFLDNKYHLYNVSGLKVGVIGVTYHEMVGMAKKDNLDGFHSLDPAPIINEIVDEIDPKTDLIIVLSHLGYDNDIELAGNLSNVDVIIGGHSHTRLKEPEKVNNILIVQAGSKCQNLGRLDLIIAGDTIQSYNGQLITLLAEKTSTNQKLISFADSFEVVIDEQFGQVIGYLEVDWVPAYRDESNVGNWLCDVMREKTGADIALLNSGGIRKRIPEGPVTLIDIAEMLPFENYVQTFSCSGSDLMKIVQENADAQANETHGILQISGLKYKWKWDGDKAVIYDIFIDGRPIKSNSSYKIASVDYVISGYDRYLKMVPGQTEGSQLVSDIIIEEIKEKRDIRSGIEGRITTPIG